MSQDFIESSGLDLPKVTFHSLRATWCTTMLQAGIPETEVRKMGGWSDRKAFEKYINWAGIRVAGITRNLGLDGGVAERTEGAEVIHLPVG